MKFKNIAMALAVVISAGVSSTTQALALTYGFVGSWEPYLRGAPLWYEGGVNGPQAFTAQEAAAHLFGGEPTDYVISTAGVRPSKINHMAWYDVNGVGGHQFAENYSNKYLGQFYCPTTGYSCCSVGQLYTNPASSLIRNNFVFGINYAFRATPVSAVPLPASLALLLTGFAGLLGTSHIRKRR